MCQGIFFDHILLLSMRDLENIGKLLNAHENRNVINALSGSIECYLRLLKFGLTVNLETI